MKLLMMSLFAMFAIAAQAEQITMTIGQTKELGSCRGTLSATESKAGGDAGDQLNLVFHGVENCTEFTVVKANGETLNKYDSKPLPNKEKRGMGGSFTIAKKLIADGFNNIKVNIKSEDTPNSDTIKVMFNAIVIPAPSKPADPVIVTPPSSGSNH